MAFFKTFGMQEDDRSHFMRGVSEQGYMQKKQFPKDGVRRVVWAVS